MGYIYKTTNLANGKVYIGQRVRKPFSPYYLGSGIAISRAVAKYGSESFVVEPLIFSSGDLDWLEQHLIQEYREILGAHYVYNMSSGGIGGDGAKGKTPWNKGKINTFKHTAVSKQKLSIANKGKRISIEQRHKISLAQKGKIITEEQKQKMRDNHADFTGSKHPRWIPDKKRFSNCVDCGKQIGPTNLRCISCRNREINRVRYGN